MTNQSQNQEVPKFHLRERRQSDNSFILSAWLKSLRHSDQSKHICNEVLFPKHQELIKRIIAKSQVCMVVNPEDHDQIYAFVVFHNNITHYCYTKYNFRKFGIMSKVIKDLNLLSNKVNPITHLPRDYKKAQEKYHVQYNPYILELYSEETV